MITVKDLILIEFQDDNLKALEFSGYEKITEQEYKEGLDELELDEIIDNVMADDFYINLRFFFINEQANRMIAELTGFDVINGMLYREIKENKNGE